MNKWSLMAIVLLASGTFAAVSSLRSERRVGAEHTQAAAVVLGGGQSVDWRNDPFGPKLARGTATQFGAFEFNDLDTINLFNGSMNLAVPLGQTYPAGGALSYQLVAHYNSTVVDIRVRHDISSNVPPPGRHFPIAIPAPLSSAGVGWYVHLGRLVEPIVQAEFDALPFIEREKRLSTAMSWQYIAQDGSVLNFHDTLHGENNGPTSLTQPLYTRDGTYVRLIRLPYGAAGCTNSGLLACAKVEMGDGTVQFFEKRALWPDSPFNRDLWRLRRIQDRVGNAIDVNYFQDRWEVDDRYRDPQKVYWEVDPWFGGRVDRVVTTAFNAQTATYDFSYTDINFERLNETGNVWETHQVGRLNSIVRPDMRVYGFNSAQITRMTLPAGGSVEWSYLLDSGLPSTFDCVEYEFVPENLASRGGFELPSAGSIKSYIARRKAFAANGTTVLKETTYLRGLDTSPLIPDQYCAGYDGIFTEPGSELSVGVFEKYKSGRGRFSINYFSVWPFGRRVNGLNDDTDVSVDLGGWKAEDFGQPFTRNEKRAGYYLSSRNYECGLDSVSDTNLLLAPKTFAAQNCGNPLRSRYVLPEQDYVDCILTATPGLPPPPPNAVLPPELAIRTDADWRCLGANATSRVTFQVFHDDDRNPLDGKERSVVDASHESDGFGGYRRLVTKGNFVGNGARDKRTTARESNAGRGILDRLADGRIDTAADENGDGLPGDDDNDGQISTWTNVPATSPWILTTYNHRQVHDADGKIYRQQVCIDGDTGLLRRIRVKKSTGSATPPTTAITESAYDEKEDPADALYDGDLRAAGDYDGIDDVVYEYEYGDAANPGLATTVKIYGGDIQPLPPASVGSGCNYNFAAAQTPKYRLTRDFRYGVLKSAKVAGSTTTVENNIEIDQNTGLTTQSKDPSGVIVSNYAYDLLGRVTAVTRTHGADQRYVYCLPGYVGVCNEGAYAGQRVVVTESVKGGTVFQKAESYYDELGRVFQSDTLHPDALDANNASHRLRVTREFSTLGWPTFVSSPQRSDVFNGSMGTRTSYDSFGRPTQTTGPDGAVATIVYRGTRETRTTMSRGVVDNATSIGQKTGTMIAAADRYGNAVTAIEPISTTGASAVCGGAGTVCRTLSVKYDGMNRPIEKIVGGQKRLFVYDGRGFLISEQHPELGQTGNGHVRYKEYDAVGNVGRKCDGGDANCTGAASLLAYEYDTEGRLSKITDGSAPYLVNSYGTTGNQNGKLVSAQRYNYVTPQNTGGAITANGSRRVTYNYTYEAIGKTDERKIEIHDTTAAPFLMASFSQAWDYDETGRVKAIHYPRCTRIGCVGTDTARTVNLSYGKGALIGMSTDDNLGASFSYHVNGQLASIAHGSPTIRRTDFFGIGPNRMRRTSSINLAAVSAAVPGHLDLGAHVYDGSGDIIKIGGTSFAYDFLGRLVKSYLPGFWGASQSFVYDQYDNMTAATPDSIGVSTSTNRLIDPSMSFNSAGYLTGIGPYRTHYDDFGKQESMIFNPNAVVSPCVLSNITGNCWLYWYGPDGERIGGINLLAGGGGDYYWTIRDLGGNVLRTYKSVNESIRPTEDFVYAGRLLIGSKDAATGIAKHYHSDHLGSTRVSTNAASGLSQRLRSFSPYGRSAGDGGVGAPIAEWAAYEKDPNGLSRNLKARSYYDVWGRFFTPDPARDGWNLYAYAGNDPINTIDPTGLYGCPTAQAIGDFNQQAIQNHDPSKGPVTQFREFNADECARFLKIQAETAANAREVAGQMRTIADKLSREEELTGDEKDVLNRHKSTVGKASDTSDTITRLAGHADALEKAAAMMESNTNGNTQFDNIVLPFDNADEDAILGRSAQGGTTIEINMSSQEHSDDVEFGMTIAHEALHNGMGEGGTLGMGQEVYSGLERFARKNPDDAIRNPQSLIQMLHDRGSP